MINPENYLSKIASVDLIAMPMPLQKGHEFLMKATVEATDWNTYHNSTAIRKTIQLYFERLAEFLAVHKPNGKPSKAKAEPDQTAKAKPAKVPKPTVELPMMVERMPEELRFIKRFVNLDGKTKTKEDILRFINSLQKAIVEKRIRKTSPYADQIKYVQERLIEVYNTMKAKIKLELKPETFEALKKLTVGEKVMASIGFIKRYIAMNEKPGMKEKAKALLQQINRAYEKGRITDSDPYIVEIHELKKNLKAFATDKTIKTLEIEQAALNGLEGILGCACQNLNGIDGKPAIMNSMDFANMEFDTLGFTGKWLELIGDPSSNFTAMVYGKPKMGKSYLCIDFAGYLARNHGKVLYVAKEEGLDMTLQKKLNDKVVAHPNMFVSSILPTSLSSYDFIFLDSVNRLGLQPEDLNKLKSQNPSKSFIFIFQSTKDGNFRGANSFQHDVDVVIEVPEKGKAVQMGRFNQGGEISIFNN
ncbi:MAG: AAA family ATPase [Chitinophagaceae bacterium]|nr:MAG: AAA family ATPase [Chitinophagaceae bacterium]